MGDYLFIVTSYLVCYLLCAVLLNNLYSFVKLKNLLYLFLLIISICVLFVLAPNHGSIYISCSIFISWLIFFFPDRNPLKASLFLLLLRGIVGLAWYISFDLTPLLFNQYANSQIFNIRPLSIVMLIFTLLLIWLILLINKKNNFFTYTLKNSQENFIWGYIIFFGFIFFELIFFITLKTNHFSSLYSAFYGLLYIFIAIIVVSIFFKERTKSLKKDIILNKLQFDRDKMFALEEFHHDYKSFIFALTQYLENHEVQKALTLIQKENKYLNESLPNESVLMLKQLESIPLQGLIINHLKRLEKNSIFYHLSIPQRIFYIRMDTLDLIRVLNIILDNAFEASLGNTRPQINIDITQHKSLIMIHVWNKIELSSNPDMSKILSRGYSTKSGSHRGKGLHKLSIILSKYKNANFEIFIDENANFHIRINIDNLS